MRFVLASPDIPAEALLSNRANFLQASLVRFDEAFLFSNEGDEVLRQISTVANYFIFPTRTWRHGFRLGNVEILSEGYGVISPPPGGFLGILRIGFSTLEELYTELGELHPGAAQDVLPEVFTYFDCTDYRDRKYLAKEQRWLPEQSLLTYARRTKRHNPSKGLNALQHILLLLSYPWKRNCHGGYFEGELSQHLMYRLASLGYSATERAYGGLNRLSARCEEKQIRVVVSPELLAPAVVHVSGGQVIPEPAAEPPQPPTELFPARKPAGAVGFIMPNVIGRKLLDAQKAILYPADIGLGGVSTPVNDSNPRPAQQHDIQVVEEPSSEPAGTVIHQTPEPRTPLSGGTRIVLVVSAHL